MRPALFLALSAILTVSDFAAAQEPKPGDEPPVKEANTVPGTFRSFIVSDKRTDPKDPLNRTNKIHCLVCENNLNPVVAVFARSIPEGADDPLAKLAIELRKMLDAPKDASEEVKAKVAKNKSKNLAAFIIFTTLDKDFQSDDKGGLAKAAVREWGDKIGNGSVVLGLASKTADAAKGWNLEKDNDITVVFYNRMKLVQKPWTFAAGAMTDGDVKAILAAVETEIGQK